MFCKNCGSPIDENTKFCSNCGAVIVPASPPPQEAAPAPAPESAGAPPEKIKKEKVKKEKAPKAKKSKARVIVPIVAVSTVAALGVGGFFFFNSAKTRKVRDSYNELCDMTTLGTQSYLYARVLTERILEADVITSDPEEMDKLFDECIEAWEATGAVTEDMTSMAEELQSSSDSQRLDLVAKAGFLNELIFGRTVYARSNDTPLGDTMTPEDSIEECIVLADQINADASVAVRRVQQLQEVYEGRSTNIETWNECVVQTSTCFTNAVFLSGEVIPGTDTSTFNGQPVSMYQISTEPKPGSTTIDNTNILVDVGATSSTFVMSNTNSITINPDDMQGRIISEGSAISISTHTSTASEVGITFHSTSFTEWFIIDSVGGYQITRSDKYGDGALTPPVIAEVDIVPDPVSCTIVEWIPPTGAVDISNTRGVIVGQTIEEDEYEVSVTTNTLEEQIEILEAGQGEITVSMIWSTHDDLDLHVITPEQNRIYYANRTADGGTLDIDMNASSYDLADFPVENIYFPSPMSGHYEVYVRDYRDRTEDMSTFYIVRVQIGDDVQEFEGEIDLTDSENMIIEFDYDGGSSSRSSFSRTTSETTVTLSETVLEERIVEYGSGAGEITVSLIWDSWDDLDLHVLTPDGSHVHYAAPYGGGGVLDHDANAGNERTLEPMENIYFAVPQSGEYSIWVEEFNDRTEGYDTNYYLRITIGGEVLYYEGTINTTGTQISIYDSEYVSSYYMNQTFYTGHSYAYIDTQMTWMQARDFAESYGGHLVTIDSAEERDFLLGSFPDTYGWIGLIAPGGEYYWVTGEPVTYTDVCPDQPANYSDYGYYGFLYNYGQWGFTEYDDVEYHRGFYIEWDRPVDEDTLSTILASLDAGNGDITISMLWDSEDDLDLHVFTPDGSEIYYGNREAQNGYLDVDANTVSNMMDNPVENVYFVSPVNGDYWIYVNDYEDRSNGATNFLVRITINGESQIYSGTIEGTMTTLEIAGFTYTGGSLSESTLESELNNINAGTGEITVSMLWGTDDDLDLHMITPDGSEISYSNRNAQGGELDVDANVGGRTMDNPIENIYFTNPEPGTYTVFIVDYSDRSDGPTDYIVRVTVGDQSQTFTGTIDGSGTQVDIITFVYGGSDGDESVPAESELDDVLNSLGAGTGEITISMLWDSDDDLDLHVGTPDGSEICYSNSEAGGGYLDVDANVGGRTMDNPVENIYFESPATGAYSVWIEDYSDRTDAATNYLVRVTVGGQSQTFSGTIDGSGNEVQIISFNYG
ncbi:MAG: zinc-ribbon domain-containing protein [Saccharofermentans sp.]|nr:zinc-ribbon domain-containing protein [Saccharofermentans sp.]